MKHNTEVKTKIKPLQSFDLKNYHRLIAIAKKISSDFYLDLVHDHLLTGRSMNELKFDYGTTNFCDTTRFEETAKVCQKCNTIQPISNFYLKKTKNKVYSRNQCKECIKDVITKWQKEQMATNEEFREKRRNYSKITNQRKKNEKSSGLKPAFSGKIN